jgi:four helix bundle protein
MSNSVLLDKSKEFALEVIRLCNEVKTNKKESVLTNQLVRSGTSVGLTLEKHFMLTARPTLLQDYILR